MFLLTLFSGFLPGLAAAADELTDSLKFNGGVLMSLELSCRIQMSLSIDLDLIVSANSGHLLTITNPLIPTMM
jgi:hypothetical protein